MQRRELQFETTFARTQTPKEIKELIKKDMDTLKKNCVRKISENEHKKTLINLFRLQELFEKNCINENINYKTINKSYFENQVANAPRLPNYSERVS